MSSSSLGGGLHGCRNLWFLAIKEGRKVPGVSETIIMTVTVIVSLSGKCGFTEASILGG